MANGDDTIQFFMFADSWSKGAREGSSALEMFFFSDVHFLVQNGSHNFPVSSHVQCFFELDSPGSNLAKNSGH